MKKIVNECEYNDELIKEGVKASFNVKFKKMNLGVCIIFILSIILFIILKDVKFLIPTGASILLFIIFFLARNNTVKVSMDRVDAFYKEKPVKVKVIMDKDLKIVYSSGESITELCNIENYVETKNLVLVLVKGNMLVIFDKKGFIEGSLDELLSNLNEIKSNKNK